MNADELDPAAVSHDERRKEPLLMENATLSWDKVGKPTLRNIDLKASLSCHGTDLPLSGCVNSPNSQRKAKCEIHATYILLYRK